MKRFCFHPVREQKFRIVKISSGDAYPSSLTVILYSACSLRNHSLATRMYTPQFLNRRYRKRKREEERSISLTTTSVTDGARRLYRRTRSIGLILANWDKTMICGLIDSSIWQSDQQVRRRDFSLSELSGAIYCISRPGLCTFSRRDVNDVERSREFSHRRRDFLLVDAAENTMLMLTNRCVTTNTRFSRDARWKSIRLYYACGDGISFDVNHNNLRHTHANFATEGVRYRLN